MKTEHMTLTEAREQGLLKSVSLGKKGKYGNVKTMYNGNRYDSKKEAHRAMELDILKKRQVVRDWQRQVRFELKHQGVKICTYVADFRVEYHNGVIEIEDVKGFKTDIYKLKAKLMKAFYDITIKEL